DFRALGAKPADGQRHPVQGSAAEKRIEQIVGPIDPQRCTVQGGAAGPWHERLPHFRMEFTPSFGAEVQSEYIVPLHHAVEAMRAVRTLRERVGPLIQISEIRTIAADRFWISPFYQRESVAIHFTWRREQAAVMALLPDIERALAPFDPRPHWGKLFTIDPTRLRAVYPKMDDFRA